MHITNQALDMNKQAHMISALAGINPVAAALCTQEVLQCASQITSFMYVGTSGWSSQAGAPHHDPLRVLDITFLEISSSASYASARCIVRTEEPGERR